ncbi:bifunctional folylpolyglutamate synthase/dihydrofolate synthase [Planktothrix sp. FACHB-1355]|uniref:Dihydrofolate synthase/folylpolyglutamate synthase n=1 Tax=Aerosakkonema funiforme FACHB-1375 TaxID=2949571 RepID=A0A926VIC2_9CYAN|nr:Mur ligase family protein [Aerosakkonema funiforme]MBD2184441.1 bifunctional folylpolyglutamate synthase/dihydrofolate synthase [Aerosakkonema funiforme FACHB-1375]MBD3558876.1 bifunctional folylpolyglutamate synthase/dihydrofolate synthase [Planktothrix sp. FACHB-1355]
MLSPENANIDNILKAFQHFGVNLGLERIQQLLADLGNPDRQVPMIHVAGTNGKGSVCAYLSSVLTAAGYRVGRYISPHLISWNERICLNEKPISSQELQQLLLQVQSAINPNAESPTQFEVITAAAWLYFAQQKVDVAVMEVGLGGRLDATNICNSPLVTVITSISREHWQVLGPTLADIAREKAGILKPGCPAVIGQLPPEAITVVKNRIQELGCPAIFPEPAIALPTPGERWAEYQGIQYPLPLLGDFQLANSALAIASLQLLQQQGWQISQDAIVSGMANTKWLGRVQWTSWKNQRILIDGAHNPAAAIVLRQYVDSLDTKSVTWVMGILSSKDCDDIFKALLRSCDRLFLVPVPDQSSAHPEDLATLARQICPELALVATYPDLVSGLEAAIASDPGLLVLCGSLYLIGHFLSLDRPTPANNNPHL